MQTRPDIAAKESVWPRPVDAALLRWDSEGGAGPEGAQDRAPLSQRDWLTASTRDELALLRSRVMASKYLLMAVLADASDRHVDSLGERKPDLSRLSHTALQRAGRLAFAEARQLAEEAGHFPLRAAG